jgi:hypothetical protein
VKAHGSSIIPQNPPSDAEDKFFFKNEKSLIALASLPKMMKSVRRTTNPDCHERGQKNGKKESEKQDYQGWMVEERRQFAQEALSEQSHSGDCSQTRKGDRCGQEESFQNGTSQIVKVHEVPW